MIIIKQTYNLIKKWGIKHEKNTGGGWAKG
jgi:hypothetical protein